MVIRRKSGNSGSFVNRIRLLIAVACAALTAVSIKTSIQIATETVNGIARTHDRAVFTPPNPSAGCDVRTSLENVPVEALRGDIESTRSWIDRVGPEFEETLSAALNFRRRQPPRHGDGSWGDVGLSRERQNERAPFRCNLSDDPPKIMIDVRLRRFGVVFPDSNGHVNLPTPICPKADSNVSLDEPVDLVTLSRDGFLRVHNATMDGRGTTMHLARCECLYTTDVSEWGAISLNQSEMEALPWAGVQLSAEEPIVYVHCTFAPLKNSHATREDSDRHWSTLYQWVPPRPARGGNWYPHRRSLVLLTVDSVSRYTFERLLPLSAAALNRSGAVQFKRHSLVGRNSFPNFIAMQTGRMGLAPSRSSEEIASGTEEGVSDVYIDDWPHLFRDAESLGYVTAYGEHNPETSIYEYLLDGFGRQPVTHSAMPYQFAWWNKGLGLAKPDELIKDEYAGHCFGPGRPSTPSYKMLLEWGEEVLRRSFCLDDSDGWVGGNGTDYAFWSCDYPVYLHIHINLAHDGPRELAHLDPIFSETLTRILSKDISVIVAGDHGLQSSRMAFDHQRPALYVRTAPNITEQFPSMLKWIKENAKKMTTSFDLYEAMQDLLRSGLHHRTFGTHNGTNPAVHWYGSGHGASFLRSNFPNNTRSCDDMGIPPEYCPCIDPVERDLLRNPDGEDKILVEQLGRELVKHINSNIRDLSPKLCAFLKLKAVKKAFLHESGAVSIEAMTLPSNATYNVKFYPAPLAGGRDGNDGRLRHSPGPGSGLTIRGKVLRYERYGHQAKCLIAFAKEQGDNYTGPNALAVEPFCYCGKKSVHEEKEKKLE